MDANRRASCSWRGTMDYNWTPKTWGCNHPKWRSGRVCRCGRDCRNPMKKAWACNHPTWKSGKVNRYGRGWWTGWDYTSPMRKSRVCNHPRWKSGKANRNGRWWWTGWDHTNPMRKTAVWFGPAWKCGKGCWTGRNHTTRWKGCPKGKYPLSLSARVNDNARVRLNPKACRYPKLRKFHPHCMGCPAAG